MENHHVTLGHRVIASDPNSKYNMNVMNILLRSLYNNLWFLLLNVGNEGPVGENGNI